jgi:hypothetical protein
MSDDIVEDSITPWFSTLLPGEGFVFFLRFGWGD